MGAQSTQGPPGASQGAGAVPTVGQAIGPMIGKLAQMPVPQAAGLLRGVLGGNRGGPAMMQPAQGGPVPATNSLYDPRTGAFTGQRGIDWQAQQAGQGGGQPMLPPQWNGPQFPNAPMPPRRPQFGQSGGPPAFASSMGPPELTPRQPQTGVYGGGVPAVSGNRQGVIDAVRSGFTQLGYNPVATAGILGNIRQESNFDPRVFTPGGDSGTAHGLFQDRGPRFTGLIDYARQRGMDPNSPQAQVGFANQEIAGIPGLRQQLNRASSPAVAAEIFGRRFERPKVVEPSRGRYAQEFYGGGSASPQIAQRGPAPVAPATEQATQRKQAAVRQQAAPPPIPEPAPPQPPLEINTQQFAPRPQPQQQEPAVGSRASNLNQGPPMIDHPDKLKGMKPGSMFRSPDGKIRIVPLAPEPSAARM